MANTYIGSGILYGCGSTLGTVTGLGASITLTESSDLTLTADKEEIKDASGNVSGVVYYNKRANATVSFIPTNTTASGNITLTAVPAGTTLALTDASMTTMGGTWIVDDCQITRSNTAAAMARLSLSKYIENSVPA